jgi:hypothetical protein
MLERAHPRCGVTQAGCSRSSRWPKATPKRHEAGSALRAEPDGRAILPRFPLDIADEVLLGRIGLATQDDELAQLALSTAGVDLS